MNKSVIENTIHENPIFLGSNLNIKIFYYSVGSSVVCRMSE